MSFIDLSPKQKEMYKSIYGYNYVDNSLCGMFMTNAPYDNHDWKYSPWRFDFQFQQETGYLLCLLSHRMTNDRAYGLDYEGNELSNDIIEKIYESI